MTEKLPNEEGSSEKLDDKTNFNISREKRKKERYNELIAGIITGVTPAIIYSIAFFLNKHQINIKENVGVTLSGSFSSTIIFITFSIAFILLISSLTSYLKGFKRKRDPFFEYREKIY